MLSLPPTNHSACGGSHLRTVSHFLNQCSSSSAIRAQNASGASDASRLSASSSSALTRARAANSSGGGKTRSSWRTDSMLDVDEDITPQDPFGFRLSVWMPCVSETAPRGKARAPRARRKSAAASGVLMLICSPAVDINALNISDGRRLDGAGRRPRQGAEQDGHAADRREEIPRAREQEGGQGRRRSGLGQEPRGRAEEDGGADDQEVER